MMIKLLARAYSILLLLLLLLITVNPTIAMSTLLVQNNTNNNTTSSSTFNLCSPFNCGNLSFPFPFSSSLTFGLNPQDCGLPGYQVTCDDAVPYSSLFAAGIILCGRLYQVKDLYPSERLITVVDSELIKDLMSGSCNSLRNLSISSSASYIPPLSLPSWTVYFTLFQCPSNHQSILPQEFLDKVVSNFTCREGNVIYVWQNGSQFDPPRFGPLSFTPNGCSLIRIPVSTASYWLLNRKQKNNSRIELVDVLADGFPLAWSSFEECDICSAAEGRCGFDGSLRRIVCSHEQENVKHYEKKWKKRDLTIGIACGCCFAMIITYLAFRKQISPNFKTNKKAQSSTNGKGINAQRFIRTYRSGLLTNYTYNDIKQMTKGFKEKLGEGGFGNVYKGKLPDGLLVAIKLLEKSNHIGHDFVNEVAAIGRIHHVNAISLIGFSCNGSKQALIYEYMPNGSLADLLSSEEFRLSFGLPKMLEIAIGIAHGIEYLHNGCESRILHLDIKPQNVLLDHNFNPKISDFGLAKVYSRSQSAVLMTSAKGTIGYIAPEIFMRSFGNASHKSDVYSFGMLLLEMVEGQNCVESNTTAWSEMESDVTVSSEAYFPGNIYKIIEKNVDSQGESNNNDEVDESYIVRKMVMVGLWCIQISPKDRPSMKRVLEMLTGDLAAIEIPPKPFFFSPPRVQHEIDITSIDSGISESESSFISNNYETENCSEGSNNSCKDGSLR